MRQSAVSYFADMVSCPLLALALSRVAIIGSTRTSIVEWFLLMVIGAALWTLVEYLMHRLIYHRVAFLRKYHELHHDNPQVYLGAPPLVGTAIVFLVSFVPLAIVAPNLANGLSVGMLMGYTVYMLVHHASHFWPLRPGSYLYRARLHHMVHHYRDEQCNFGVSTSLWDRAFGTHKRAVAARPLDE